MKLPKGIVDPVAKKAGKLFDRAGKTPNEVNVIATELAPEQQAMEMQRQIQDNTQLGRVVDPARHEHRNFTLDSIDTADDIKTMIDDVNYDLGEVGALSSKVQTNEELSEKAVKLKTSIDEMVKLNPRKMTSVQVERSRMMMATAAEEVFELSQKVTANPGDVKTMYEFRRSAAMLTAINATVRGAANEAGRITQSFARPVGSFETQANAMMTTLSQFGTPKSTAKLAALIQQTGGDAVDIIDATKETWGKKTAQAINEYFINNLLWGVKTHAANIGSNIGTSFWGVGERYTASAIGAARNALKVNKDIDAVSLHEANAMMIGTIDGYKDSMKVFWRALKQSEANTGQTELMSPGAVKTEAYYKPAITADNMGINPNSTAGKMIDGIGQYYVRLPGKLLSAEDEVFKTVGYLAQSNAHAVRSALSEGLEYGTKEFTEKVQKIIRGEDEVYSGVVNDAAVGFSKEQTFTDEITDSVTLGVSQISNATPVIKVHVPFVRVISNLMKYSIERSPAALASGRWREQYMAGGAERDIALAKMGMGSTVSMLVWNSMMNTEVDSKGNENLRPRITGAGPKSRAMQKVWQQNGIKPWSIYIGGKYVQYNRLDPFGQILGSTAVTLELMNGMYNEGEREEAIFALATGLGEYLADKTYFTGFAEMFDVISGERKLSQHTARKVASFSPKWLSDVARATDNDEDGNPIIREKRGEGFLDTLINQLEARTPGLQDNNFPKVDMFGNDVVLDHTGWFGYNLSPAQFSEVQHDDKVANELFEQGYGFMEPNSKMKFHLDSKDTTVDIDLLAADDTGKLFYEWRKMVGKERYKEIRKEMSKPSYYGKTERDDTAKEGRRYYLQRAARRGRETAKKQFLRRYSKQLREAAIELVDSGEGVTAAPYKGSNKNDKLERSPFK